MDECMRKYLNMTICTYKKDKYVYFYLMYVNTKIDFETDLIFFIKVIKKVSCITLKTKKIRFLADNTTTRIVNVNNHHYYH